jgi:pimeloyl-ACP methyl ester carboxylesterase
MARSVSTFDSFDGTTLSYLTYGSPGERPPVVLLHGFAADSQANWVAPGVVDALVGAGRHVVAVDARGHGRSEKPHDPGAYAGDAMVRDVRSLIDHLGAEQVDVCGYSMGALTTYALVASEPRARSAVLGGMGANLGGRSMAERAPLIAEALLVDDPATITNPVAKAFRAFADSTGADRHALAAIQRSPRAPMADGTAITVPTMVIVGDADTLVGSPQQLASRIPGATAEVVSGDHLTAVFDPRFKAAIVAFLDRVDHHAGG